MYLIEQEKEIVTNFLAYDSGTLWEIYANLDCAPVDSALSETATYINVRGHSRLLNAGEKVKMFTDPAYSIWKLNLLIRISEMLEELGLIRLYHSGFKSVPSVFLKDGDDCIHLCAEIDKFEKTLSSVVMLTDGLSEFIDRGYLTEEELEKKRNFDLSLSALNATQMSNELAKDALLVAERNNALSNDALAETRQSNSSNRWLLGFSLVLNLVLTAITLDRNNDTAWKIAKQSQTMRSDSTFTISLDQKSVEALSKALQGVKKDSVIVPVGKKK